jgi:hypothetical protein
MFDIRKDPYAGAGELDDRRVQAYIDGLMVEFAASPEAQPFLETEDGLGWAGMMMEYGFSHLGVSPARMSRRDFHEVVFELFPRKVSVEPDSAAAIVSELGAFWQFVRRQYGLPNADQILAALDNTAAQRLRKELADPSNYGMAKSFVMLGQEAGFDMTTQEGLEQFQLLYNSQLLANHVPPAGLDAVEGDWPALPPSPLSPKERAEKRKARKRQRQARKRNRRK